MNRKFSVRWLDSCSVNRKSNQRYLKFSAEFWIKGIGKTVTRAKAQRPPRFGELSRSLSLRAWRLGAITFFVSTVGSINC